MSEFSMDAENKDSLSACLDRVTNSDIYVLILGGRYGRQPKKIEFGNIMVLMATLPILEELL